jgi:hypothetical protein
MKENILEELDKMSYGSYLAVLKCIGFDRNKMTKGQYGFDEFIIMNNASLCKCENRELMQELVDLELMKRFDNLTEEYDGYTVTDFGLRYIQGREHIVLYKAERI